MMLDDNIFHWSMQEREHPNMGMSGRMSVEKKGIVCICITKCVHTVCPSQNLRLVQSPSHGGSLDPPRPLADSGPTKTTMVCSSLQRLAFALSVLQAKHPSARNPE